MVERPGGKPLIREGQVNRQLLGGTWYFRLDDTLVQGDTERWYAQQDLIGWQAITVPHNWNATDTTLNKSSVGWYRKEFTLPRAPKNERALHFWKVRFEGSNYRTKVWLNGRVIGGQSGLFPFEAELSNLQKGRNTLVVKVSSVRSSTDLTHWRPAAFNGYGSGGWWNFGGLLREVYVREVDTVGVADVQVVPRLRRVGGAAKVEVRTLLENPTGKDRDAALVLDVDGQRIRKQPETVPARGTRKLETTFTIKRPRLWQPGDPELYSLAVGAEVDGERKSTYKLSFGVKKLEVRSRRHPAAERPPARPARREHRGGRPRGGRRTQPGDPQPAGRAPQGPRRHRHPLPVPAPPGVDRGLRPRGNHVLARGADLPAPQQALRQGPPGGGARGRPHGPQQHEQPVDLHLVAGQRAGREPLRAGRDRPRPGALHRRRRRGQCASSTTRG